MHTRLLLVLLLAPAAAGAQQATSPYAGQEARTIKALSADEVKSLLEGEGMGFAKAAELNHYPGPRHALQLAAELKLSADQRAAIQRVFNAMQADARRLGAEIVAREGRLDSLFAAHVAADQSVRESVSNIARLTGELRATHLAAHLRVAKLLTPDQIAAYDAARGYHGDTPAGHVHGGGGI